MVATVMDSPRCRIAISVIPKAIMALVWGHQFMLS
jgi:hypothetical protein